ncbi:MAG: truB [Phycisphaerales bacterium]|nr:truB [Phycisphaerales bacterium]
MLLEGVINLDKPAGLTSARAVGRVKHLLPRGTKIGHAGTLDPFATGVLLLLVGKATKSCERLMGERKGYEAVVKFGGRSATDDLEGPIEAIEIAQAPEMDAVRAAAERFVGAIQQRPPAFSAMKVGGRRAYKLARQGEIVELQPRTVTVYSLELMEYAWPVARLRIECGRGTYIRAIARDLGEGLGVGGYLTELRRTFIGRFDVRDAVSLERISVDGVEAHLKLVE